MFRNFLVGLAICLLACAPVGAGINHGNSGGGPVVTPALFVAYDTIHGSTCSTTCAGTTANPTSGGSGRTVQAGDEQFVTMYEGSTSTGTIMSPLAGGTLYTLVNRTGMTGSSQYVSVWCRILTSADIGVGSAAIVYAGQDPNGIVSAITYRGPTVCPSNTLITPSIATTGTILTIGASSPIAGSKGLVLIVIDLADTTPSSLTLTGFTFIVGQHIWSPNDYHLSWLTSPGGGGGTLGTFPVNNTNRIGFLLDLGAV